MRAATRRRYGGPAVIRVDDVAVPEPGDGELLVRVHASTISRTDCALLAATPFIMRFGTGLLQPRHHTLGTDFAGRVEAVGAGVDRFQAGNQVWGLNDMGIRSHAEYLVVSQHETIGVMPPHLGFEEAVACLEGAWYACSIVERAGMGQGRRVLINGATGAIGSALLQVCVARGADVTAVGNTRNLELLRALGATRVIDYERTDFTRDHGVYDYVFDAVGKSTFGACRHLLEPGGVFVSSDVGPGGQNLLLALVTPWVGRRRVAFPLPIDRKAFLETIHRLTSDGRFRAVIDRTVSLDGIREGYAYAASGQKTGAVVLTLA